MGLRFNPPPEWPPIPAGFVPEPGWQPDPSWPPPPPGWPLWVSDDHPPPPSGKVSGWAIASFVLGLLSGTLLSIIFGFVALSRIKRLGQRGRGLAIAGIVLSGLWILLIVVALVVANADKPTRSAATGQISRSGRLNAFSLQVGDCFDNPAGAASVKTLTAIPCGQPHNAQIFAKFKLTGSAFSYPGSTAVKRLATSGCNARIGSVDKPLTTSTMSIRMLFPQEGGWMSGQRTVSCMISNPTANITSSLLNP